MFRKRNKTFALLLITVFVSVAFYQTNADAAEAASEKEEVVYVNLDANGNSTGTYVVNSFQDKSITDYGTYSQIKNMNTTDKINYLEDTVTIQSSADKLYYEGVLDRPEIPWSISISYKLDGVEYSAAEIAGKSGKLEMDISISQNKNAKEGFFENFALQTIVKLDTSLCKNIIAEEATQANVGILKQLTYTLLPGTSKNIVITADVTDFEMEGIQLNGIRFNLGIDSSTVDTSVLGSRINDLQNAVTKLDEGANDIENGAGSLNGGAVKLNDGIEDIYAALDQLNDKSLELTKGSGDIKKALETIQLSLKEIGFTTGELEKLSTASKQMKEGIDGLVSGLQKMDGSIDTYYTKLSEAGLTDLNTFITKHNELIASLGITNTQRLLYNAYLTGGIDGVQLKLGELVKASDSEATALYKKASGGNTQVITEYITSAGTIISTERILKADIAYIQGSEQLIGGMDGSLDSKNGKLMTGALSLQSSYTTFNTGIQDMVSSLTNLAASMTKLKEGIDFLVSSYDKLDNGIGDYTGAVSAIKEGYQKVYNGSLELVNGTSDLYHGTKTLVDGTGEFVNETSGMDQEIDQEIDKMLQKYSGSGYQAKSFVSDKNTNVKSVQFVIKTSSIEKEEVELEVVKKDEHLDFWQKLKKLFGI